MNQKDVILLLNQEMTSNERQAASQAAIAFGNEYHIVNFRRFEDGQPGEQSLPTGAPAIPAKDSC